MFNRNISRQIGYIYDDSEELMSSTTDSLASTDFADGNEKKNTWMIGVIGAIVSLMLLFCCMVVYLINDGICDEERPPCRSSPSPSLSGGHSTSQAKVTVIIDNFVPAKAATATDPNGTATVSDEATRITHTDVTGGPEYLGQILHDEAHLEIKHLEHDKLTPTVSSSLCLSRHSSDE